MEIHFLTPFLNRVLIATLPLVSLARLVCRRLRRFSVDGDSIGGSPSTLLLSWLSNKALNSAVPGSSLFQCLPSLLCAHGVVQHCTEGYLAAWMWAGYWYLTWHDHTQLNRFYLASIFWSRAVTSRTRPSPPFQRATLKGQGWAWGRG